MEKNPGSRRILIVDDDELNSMALGQRLERRGIKVIVISDTEKLFETIQKNKIELILLDIVMPKTDGITLLKQIREKFGRDELPVIMTTALDDSFDIVDAFKIGANDYINKPINIDVALARIHAHLSTIDLHKEGIQKKELEVINAMVTTYNHEINTPLAIALGCLDGNRLTEDETIERLKSSLLRVADILKKIRSVTDKEQVHFNAYSDFSKKVKLK